MPARYLVCVPAFFAGFGQPRIEAGIWISRCTNIRLPWDALTGSGQRNRSQEAFDGLRCALRANPGTVFLVNAEHLGRQWRHRSEAFIGGRADALFVWVDVEIALAVGG